MVFVIAEYVNVIVEGICIMPDDLREFGDFAMIDCLALVMEETHAVF